MKRLFSWAAMAAFLASAALLSACDDDDPVAPTTGSVSGRIDFVGTWPATGMVILGLYASLPPMGPPDAYTDPIPAGASYAFTLSGIDPATYDGIVVGWLDAFPIPTSEETLGFYWQFVDSVAVDGSGAPRGFPLPITVVAGQTTGNIDITADLDVAP